MIANMTSYYPKYAILDSIINQGYRKIYLYVDLKNILKTMYIKNVVENITENIKISKQLDISIFSSIINFLSFHKTYAMKRDIEIHPILFFDFGTSIYHQNVYKKYKISRRIDDAFGLDKTTKDIFADCQQKNLELIYSIGNKIPNTKVIKLEHLESDFIPYHLLKDDLVEKDDKIAHLIYSDDKDLMQCVQFDNTFQFRKHMSKSLLVQRGDVLSTFLKFKNDIPDKYMDIFLAIIGDIQDDVQGISGIGPKKIIGVFEDLKNIIDVDNIHNKIERNDELFPLSIDEYKNKINNKTTLLLIQEEKNNKSFSRDMKLVSFELISRALDSSTDMLERKKNIENIMTTENIVSLEKIEKALRMNRIFIELEWGEFQNLYNEKIDNNFSEIINNL